MSEATERPLFPETAADALARWDAGEGVFTVEMGGLGPSYEQCIHILAFEIIRDALAQGFNPADAENMPREQAMARQDALVDPCVARTSAQTSGYSGAQVGAATSLAMCMIRQGWAKGLEAAGVERHIQVSRDWPARPATKEGA